MVVCNVEVLSDFLVLLVGAVVDDTIVANGCLVDFTERWIDCLLLLLAIEDEAEEEEVSVVALQFVAMVDDEAADVDLESLDKLSLFFDLYFRVDLSDCLVVATISVDGCLILLR